MTVAIILGTRPEIIKMSPVIRACEERGVSYFLLHTGQHYSYNMDAVFFEQLRLPKAKYNLDVGSGTHGEQTAKILTGVEKVLIKEKPSAVLVQGDTNTVLSGALAAVKMHIRIGHVEAGLRSFDERMPEEINRTLADHMATFLFAPTALAKMNLLRDGISEKKIFVVGNTIVDAVCAYSEVKHVPLCHGVCFGLHFPKGSYILATLHRAENVDVKGTLRQILKGIELVHRRFGMPVVCPIHPRTQKMIKKFRLSVPQGVKLIEPVGYVHLLHLLKNARLVLTDSGGLQEECCILKTPCVTMRLSTERSETVNVGANIIAGTKALDILKSAETMANKRAKWQNPFGDGKTSERIIKILLGKLG